MRGRLALAVTVAATFLHPSAIWAGMTDCRFALHRQAATTKSETLCGTYSPNASSIPCRSYVTTAPIMAASHVYMVIAHGGSEGISAVSFGIDYDGGLNAGMGLDPDLVTVTWCADGLAFPNDGGFGEFPRPKGGVRVTWNIGAGSCQLQVNGDEGVHAVIGVLYCYAFGADQLQITPNNNVTTSFPELAVADCAGITTGMYEVWSPAIVQQIMGRVDFGGGLGYNPCLVTPTAPTTWGKMKSMY